MADKYLKLYQGQVPTTAAAVYTVGATAGTYVIVKSIRIVNTSANVVSIKLWHDGLTDPYVILPATNIDAGGFGEFDGTLTMEASDTIGAQAGAATSLTMTVYGLEITP
jgi:hypothetical protein